MRSRIATISTLAALVAGTGIAIAAGESGSSATGQGGAAIAQYKPGKGCGKGHAPRHKKCPTPHGNNGNSGVSGQGNSRSGAGSGSNSATAAATPSTGNGLQASQSTALCVVAPPVHGHSGSTDGKTITLSVTCGSGSVTIKVLEPPKTSAEVANPTVLAQGLFTISAAGASHLKMPLTNAGKEFFKSHSGHAVVEVAQISGGIETVSKHVKVKIV